MKTFTRARSTPHESTNLCIILRLFRTTDALLSAASDDRRKKPSELSGGVSPDVSQ